MTYIVRHSCDFPMVMYDGLTIHARKCSFKVSCVVILRRLHDLGDILVTAMTLKKKQRYYAISKFMHPVVTKAEGKSHFYTGPVTRDVSFLM